MKGFNSVEREYHNDAGEVISKEEREREYNKFKQEVENAYNKKAKTIIDEINKMAKTDEEKLKILYNYFCDNMKFDLHGTADERGNVNYYKYPFKNYKNWKISQENKYPALICNKGVCMTFSEAFADLSNKLGIPCRRVSGFTTMKHSWNIVLINDEIKHIDVAFAIMFKNKQGFFLKDFEELGHRTINSSVEDLKLDMERQLRKANGFDIYAINGKLTSNRFKVTNINGKNINKTEENGRGRR